MEICKLQDQAKKFLLSFLLLFLAACQEHQWIEVDIPEESNSRYQGNPFSRYSQQTSFTWIIAYPDASIISNLESSLGGDWEQCRYYTNKWESYSDISGVKPKYVFQRLVQWRNIDKKQFIFATLRYEQDIENTLKPQKLKKPNHVEQQVTIIESHIPWWSSISKSYENQLCENEFDNTFQIKD